MLHRVMVDCPTELICISNIYLYLYLSTNKYKRPPEAVSKRVCALCLLWNSMATLLQSNKRPATRGDKIHTENEYNFLIR